MAMVDVVAKREFVSSDFGNVMPGKKMHMTHAFYEHLRTMDLVHEIKVPVVIEHPAPRVSENKMQSAERVAPEKKESMLSKVTAKITGKKNKE